jgi:hypothetical protein
LITIEDRQLVSVVDRDRTAARIHGRRERIVQRQLGTDADKFSSLGVQRKLQPENVQPLGLDLWISFQAVDAAR